MYLIPDWDNQKRKLHEFAARKDKARARQNSDNNSPEFLGY